MDVRTKEQLIEEIKQIAKAGWHKSVKDTSSKKNDGAVGNTLEVLLGVPENNLPIPNTNEWELKGQRLKSTALFTFKHTEPSPIALEFVSSIFLPQFGWRHKEAGKEYSEDEKSFRSTTNAKKNTVRGFRLIIDRNAKKVRFIFESEKAKASKPEIKEWLKMVEMNRGLSLLNPEPYWGFDDLMYVFGSKLKNCFYVVADTKKVDDQEYFRYLRLNVLSGFSFEKMIDQLELGNAYVDFDARTRHNHGTKFRIKQRFVPSVYEHCQVIELI